MFHFSGRWNWIRWKKPWSYLFTMPVSLSWLFTLMVRSPCDPWTILFVWTPHRKPSHQKTLHWQQGIGISLSPLTANLNYQYHRNFEDLYELIIQLIIHIYCSLQKHLKSCPLWWASWRRMNVIVTPLPNILMLCWVLFLVRYKESIT